MPHSRDALIRAVTAGGPPWASWLGRAGRRGPAVGPPRPRGVAVDRNGDLAIGDTDSNRVRLVAAAR